jgi:hypothetical protein
MMLPFFCGGFGIGLVFVHFGQQASRVYACDILGAGAGSLGIIVVLFVVSPSQALSALTVMVLLAAAVAVVELKLRPRWLMELFIGLALLAALALPGIPVHPSPYKDLSQALDIAGARVVEERSSPLGQVTVVENTRVPLRDAPGMSLNAVTEPPPQLGVYVDGNGPSALTQFTGDLAPLAYLGQPFGLPHLTRAAGAGERGQRCAAGAVTTARRWMRWNWTATSPISSGAASATTPATFTQGRGCTCMKLRRAASSMPGASATT